MHEKQDFPNSYFYPSLNQWSPPLYIFVMVALELYESWLGHLTNRSKLPLEVLSRYLPICKALEKFCGDTNFVTLKVILILHFH